MLVTQNDDENTAWLEMEGRKMNCPECGGKTEIIDTEKYSMYVWRRRRCYACNYRVNTHENFVDDQKATRTKKAKELDKDAPAQSTRKRIEDMQEYFEYRKTIGEDNYD